MKKFFSLLIFSSLLLFSMPTEGVSQFIIKKVRDKVVGKSIKEWRTKKGEKCPKSNNPLAQMLGCAKVAHAPDVIEPRGPARPQPRGPARPKR